MRSEKRGSAERVDGAEVGTNERQGEKDRLSDHNDIKTIVSEDFLKLNLF